MFTNKASDDQSACPSPGETAAKITQHSAQDLPNFVRLPKTGKRCPWTGLTRSSLNDLILGPHAPVKSVVVARRGASRGIRLVHLGSLLGYLNDLMDQQTAGREGE